MTLPYRSGQAQPLHHSRPGVLFTCLHRFPWVDAAPIALLNVRGGGKADRVFLVNDKARRYPMAWTRPKLREICVGMEINGYFAGTL